ncbi:uncharacterized protein I303_102507 [Kwoniella dejecticola CBS 10117]|uniref:Uncharacterized protein n=1 Tax=Kwoniella dejecticola CBS 10117 TaxID=1296121 RepID=A0A1A6A8X9_9TREE|nr:uncharacterized protein I303_02521 [Kwoniella dejecticola CBS 10117]OBR86513.1 hypothetical protein I303_02521 [Kwoniella dejecticola CBS 10117]
MDHQSAQQIKGSNIPVYTEVATSYLAAGVIGYILGRLHEDHNRRNAEMAERESKRKKQQEEREKQEQERKDKEEKEYRLAVLNGIRVMGGQSKLFSLSSIDRYS